MNKFLRAFRIANDNHRTYLVWHVNYRQWVTYTDSQLEYLIRHTEKTGNLCTDFYSVESITENIVSFYKRRIKNYWQKQYKHEYPASWV